jgi:hypothetical protein
MNQTLHNGQTCQPTPIINNQVDDMNTSNISTGSNTSISSTQDNQNLLTILTMNCRSLRSEAKRNELNTIIETHQPHIIHLQETHLDKYKQPVYSALQPFSCILVHAISQSVSRVSSPLHTVSFRTALITPPPSWPFLHVLSLRTISYRSGSSISDVDIDLSRCVSCRWIMCGWCMCKV